MSNTQIENVVSLLEAKKAKLKEEFEQNLRSIEQTILLLKGNDTGSSISTAANTMAAATVVTTNVEQPVKRKRGRPHKGTEVKSLVQAPKAEKVVSDKKGKQKKLTLNDKIVLIIKGEDRFLHNREITENYISRYPEKSRDRDKVARQISALLSFMKKDKKLVSYSIGNSLKYTYWGFREWLDDNGNIKPGYMYLSAE